MPQPELLPVNAADGHTTALLLHRPPVLPPAGQAAPALLWLPAMGMRADYYLPFAEALAEQGIATAVAEQRGHGRSSVRAGRRSDFGYRELVTLDAAAALDVLRQQRPGAPLWIGGHSLGGQVAALTLAHQHGPHQHGLRQNAAHLPEPVRGLVLVAAGTNHFRVWPRRQRLPMLAVTSAMRALAEVCGYFPGERVGFGGREALSVMRYWHHLVRTGRFGALDAASAEEGAPESVLPTLAHPCLGVSFSDDRYTPNYSLGHLMAKLLAAELCHLHLQPSDLGLASVGHFGWARHPGAVGAVAGHIAAWLRERA